MKFIKASILQIISKLPSPISDKVYRKLIVDIPIRIPEDITFMLATTKEELECAFKLVHDEYVRCGFIKAQESGMRLLVQHALPSSSVLVIKKGGEVVGTISLIRDNPLGLPMEKVFDLSKLRTEGARLMEGSCLAIHPQFRRSRGLNLFFPFLCYLHRYNENYFGVSTVVSNVYPHHSIFYSAIQGAQVVPGTKIENYLGEPAQALMINYATLKDTLQPIYQNEKINKNWFEYLYNANVPNFIFPERKIQKINDPVMTTELLRYFFLEKTNLFRNLNEKEKFAIRNNYDFKDFMIQFPDIFNDTKFTRKKIRVESKLKGTATEIGSNIVTPIVILDVNDSGLRIYSYAPLNVGMKYEFNIKLNTNLTTFETGIVRWKQEGQNYGIKILNPSACWLDFFAELYSEYSKKTA